MPLRSKLRSKAKTKQTWIKLLPEQKQSLLLKDSVSQTLKLLRAHIEPILDCETEVTFIKLHFRLLSVKAFTLNAANTDKIISTLFAVLEA